MGAELRISGRRVRMSTYLVTGATGFVGRALIRRLLQEGHSVRAATRGPAQPLEGLEAASVSQVSLGDPNALATLARDVDVLYHCAAENSPRASAEALSWINVAGTENVLNAARHAGVRRVVHVSCADVTLINRDRLNWKETQQLAEAPLDACSRSKLLAEELALHGSNANLEVCVLRPAWVWGPGDRRVLPSLCREARAGRVRMCGNGENLLPTVYIENLVHALRLADTAQHAPGHVYHVLDGEPMTAHEFLSQLCKSAGLAEPARGIYALAYAGAWLRDTFRMRGGLARADVVRRGRSALFDGLGATRDLGYEGVVSVHDGMEALARWVAQLGGPEGLARIERGAAGANDVDALVRLADAG
jgi:nucleoside-diphosphate-sugar epimerase